MTKKTQIDWIDSPIDMRVGQRIDNQVKATEGIKYSLIQELNQGVYMLTIPQRYVSSLDIKKIADRAQYSILSDRHDNENNY